LEHEKQNDDLGRVLAAQSAAALLHGCLHKNQKPYGIALDTADFVRHVPNVPEQPKIAVLLNPELFPQKAPKLPMINPQRIELAKRLTVSTCSVVP
jgi:hypothetical protein